MNRREFLERLTALGALVTLSSLDKKTTFLSAQEIPSNNNNIKLRFWQYELELKHTWTIARGSKNTTIITLLELSCDGIQGLGEAALSTAARYGETKETVTEFLKKIDFSHFSSLFQQQDILEYIQHLAPGNYAAKAAIDIALHDWLGKKLGIPLYKMWGLNPNRTPITTFSISIDTPEMMMKKTLEAAEFPILKIKVGKDNDEENIRAIRKVTDKPLRVDANEGWKTKEIALEKIKWLADQGVEFIEQPLPTSQLDDMIWLHERVKIPLIADESVTGLQDIVKLKDGFDGINIKLMKCGGINQALKMIHTARALGLKIMMGCMIESSVAISAAAQLSPLIDYADLDGNLLVSNDPYEGSKVVNGKIILSEYHGIGVKAR